ncbi:MAG: hypothetical protein ABFD61_00095 [Chloroherpetonaceae bacterium]
MKNKYFILNVLSLILIVAGMIILIAQFLSTSNQSALNSRDLLLFYLSTSNFILLLILFLFKYIRESATNNKKLRIEIKVLVSQVFTFAVIYDSYILQTLYINDSRFIKILFALACLASILIFTTFLIFYCKYLMSIGKGEKTFKE